MLIGFRVNNFKSFHREISLDFVASTDPSHQTTNCVKTKYRTLPRLTKSAVIFGPNNSGKSNLLVALKVMRDLVLHSTAYSSAELSSKFFPFCSGDLASSTTRFEIDLLINEVRYNYGFSFDARRIMAEQLQVYRSGKAQHWITRSVDETTQREMWQPFSPSFAGPREMWRKATRSTALFVTTASQLNASSLRPVMNWFEHQAEVVFQKDLLEQKALIRHIKDPMCRKRLLGLLNAVGIDVADVRLVDRHRSQKRIGDPEFSSDSSDTPLVEFMHRWDGGSCGWLDAESEAAGTLRLASSLALLLDASERDKLIAIDEFGAGLHPLVTRHLLGLIHRRPSSFNGGQLIVNTHDATLMDLDLLRRDEIWLMSRDQNGASELSVLAAYHPRKRAMVAKHYLQGSYGATPCIGPLSH